MASGPNYILLMYWVNGKELVLRRGGDVDRRGDGMGIC